MTIDRREPKDLLHEEKTSSSLKLFGFGSYGVSSVCFLLPDAGEDDDKWVAVDIVTHRERRRIEPYANWMLCEGDSGKIEYLPVDCGDRRPEDTCQYITDLIENARKGDADAVDELRIIAKDGLDAILQAREDREMYD